MLIYLDVKYTAEAQDKIQLYKNIRPLTPSQCTGCTVHRTFKTFFTFSATSNYISLNHCYLITDFFLKNGLKLGTNS